MKNGFSRKNLALTGLIMLMASAVLQADTLILKDGRTLEGTFKGGTEQLVLFEVKGKIEQIPVETVISLNFSDRAAPKTDAQSQSVAPQPAAPSTAGTSVPAGTKLMVKLEKAVSTASHQKGATITGLLDLALVVNGVTVAPKGSKVYGKVIESDGGRRIGNQKIVVQFTDLVINDQLTPIMTDPVGAEGGRGGAVKVVGAGALIGAGISGGRGAGTGALIGAGAALLAGGNHIQIPAGTVAEIVIKQPLAIK